MRLMKTMIRVLVLACAALLSVSAHAHAALIRASSPGLKEATPSSTLKDLNASSQARGLLRSRGPCSATPLRQNWRRTPHRSGSDNCPE